MSTTLFFRDDTYDGQLGRTLTAARAGMADIGEAMATARAIGKRANPTSWHDGWRARADRTAAIADSSTQPATKRGALLRASEYYRQAYFFLRHDLDDARLQDAYARHVATFQAAVPLLDTPVEQLTIELDGAVVQGLPVHPGRIRHRPTDGAPAVRLRLHRRGGLRLRRRHCWSGATTPCRSKVPARAPR